MERHPVQQGLLNKGETYPSLAETIYWANKGERRLKDLDDILNRAGCLRLVAAIVILFNAAYLQAAAKKWRQAGEVISNDPLGHIYPTATQPIGFLGEYSFRADPKWATHLNDLPLAELPTEQLELEA